MLKATVGTWLNYATTVIFQVLFAARFGSSAVASAYVLTFTIAVAIGAIFVGTTQSIYIPRLISHRGEVLWTGIRQMSWLALLACLLFAGFAGLASPLVAAVAPGLNRPGAHLPTLVRWAATFGFAQVVVGQLAAIAWARGLRFLPAVTPAIPSMVASVPLAIGHHVSTPALYALLTTGSLAQIAVLAVGACRRLPLSHHPLEKLGKLTFSFLGAYLVAQFVVPFEVLVASHASSSGGAHFNYAYRALAVVQLLIVGGLTLGALPEWSNYVRARARTAFERSVMNTTVIALLALSLAAAAALVASTLLIRVAFQHGAFHASDTRAVSAIMRVALVGFVAEGLMLVMSPALIADRRNRAVVTIGVCRTMSVLALVGVLGFSWGPIGVAAGYSAANLVVLATQVAYMRHVAILKSDHAGSRSAAVVAGSTFLVAATVLAIPVSAPSRAGIVLVAFAGASLMLHHHLPRPAGLRRVAAAQPSRARSASPGPSATSLAHRSAWAWALPYRLACRVARRSQRRECPPQLPPPAHR